MAREIYLPLVNKVHQKEADKITPAEYIKAANLDTVLHEVGHAVMPEEDEAVTRRIGKTAEATVLEELKAETVSLKLFNKVIKQKQAAEVKEMTEMEFMAKLGSAYSYLSKKSSEIGSEGERYFYTGLAIVSELLSKNVLIEHDGEYQITDPERGIEVIAGMSEEILERFYTNPKVDLKKEVRQYIKELREKKNDPALKQFLQKLK